MDMDTLVLLLRSKHRICTNTNYSRLDLCTMDVTCVGEWVGVATFDLNTASLVFTS